MIREEAGRLPALLAGVLAVALVLSGCRGMESENPPIWPQLNMFDQQSFRAQNANPFFEDGMAMRDPVPGTVARGFLREDAGFYHGRDQDGAFIDEIPITITRDVLLRGQDRYDIYCAICHGRAGDGQGIISVGDFGYTPATDLHLDYLIEAPEGHLYDVIANGIRTMPGYAQQLPVVDRWAITAYIRALQRSQRAAEEDVPPVIRAELGQPGAPQLDEEPDEVDPEVPVEEEMNDDALPPGTDPGEDIPN